MKESSEKKLNETLSQKEEQNLRLKSPNQKLLEQIRDFQDEKVEYQNKVDSENKSSYFLEITIKIYSLKLGNLKMIRNHWKTN